MNPSSLDAPQTHFTEHTRGLELLSSAIIMVDNSLTVCYINPAAENLFSVGNRQALGRALLNLLGEATGIKAALDSALAHNWSYTGQNVVIRRPQQAALHLDCTVTPVELT